MRAGLALGLLALALGLVLLWARASRSNAPVPAVAPSTTPSAPVEPLTALKDAEAALAAREELSTSNEPRRPAADPAVPAKPAANASATTLLVSARLIDEHGDPLPGARLAWVESSETELYRERQSAAADPAGGVWLAVERPRVEDEALKLVASAPERVHLFLVIRGARLREPQCNLGEQILPPGGAVEGRVLDASGAPFAGARVSVTALVEPKTEVERRRLRVWDWPVRISQLPVRPVALTGLDGRYRIDGVPLGRFALLAQVVPSTGELRLPVRSYPLEVLPGVSVLAPDLVLEHPSFAETVVGIVRDAQGEPIGGMAILVLNKPDPAWSDADGRFRLLVPEGEAVLLYANQGEEWAVARDVRGGTADVDLGLTESQPPLELLSGGLGY